jgi:CRP-like cAMP-binding protein
MENEPRHVANTASNTLFETAPTATPEATAATEATTEAAALASLPYFAGLAQAELEAAAGVMSPVEALAGEVIFAQGGEGAWIYLLERGQVEISIELPASTSTSSTSSPRGRRVLARLGAPALLGEMSALLDEPRSAWAVALDACALWQVSREELRLALERGEPWAQRLLLAMSRVLAARLSEVNRALAALGVDNEALSEDVAVLQESLYLCQE